MRRLVSLILTLALAILPAAAMAEGSYVSGNGDDVTQIQERLIWLGFLEGSADGKYGPKTAAAVGAFLALVGETGDGTEINAAQISRLYDDEAGFYARDLSFGDSGDETLRLQRCLALAGCLDPSEKTGAFGAETVRAVCAYQAACGLEITGTADENTQKMLYRTARAQTKYGLLSSGDTGNAVLQAQTHLYEMGYLADAPDGKFGGKTKDALAAFLTDALGIPCSGETLDPGAQALLADRNVAKYARDYRLGDDDPGVVRVLRLLTRYGYYDGEITAVYTKDAENAVSYFQQKNGMTATGVADEAAQKLLYSGRVPLSAAPAPRDLAIGDTSKQARAFQETLIRTGFLLAPADGAYGTETEQAARKLLAYLTALGEDGWDTVDPGDAKVRVRLEIDLPASMLRSGDAGDAVERLQTRLNSLGYLGRLKIDGKFGETTKTAVALFQSCNGLTDSGVANGETLALLYSDAALGRPTRVRAYVSLDEQKVYVYTLTADGGYALAREMICSSGLNDATPTGVFCQTTGAGQRWHYFEEFDCWAQYAYFIENDIMFHSVIYAKQDESTLRASSVSALGKPASHGCVRLALEDAKWVYENCPTGTVVTIYKGEGTILP